MIKFVHGWIRNQAGEQKDILVKAATPNRISDMLIGGSIVLIGVAYLTATAFKNGAIAYEAAEHQTMIDLGVIKESADTIMNIESHTC